ncbi:MAG: CoA-binding protein [Candidatus Omnitrophota bacterium]|nr:CoA-binding protein [Candidatus Omnitrophota bacterium]MDZ4242078.1 CoA-binding protein [Candidatus Omnitrophota bacterium]
MNVAVIGASDKTDRYSYKAVKLAQEKGHRVYPVHQRIKQIEGLSVYLSIRDIVDPIDTVSLYVAADISTKIGEDILAKKPRRIIFNPGAENAELEARARGQGILTLNACTLVMLNTGQF